MNRKKKILVNSSAALLYEGIAIICGFILPRLILSSFGSQYNGVVSSITQFLSFITLFRSGIGGVTKVHLYKSLSEKDMINTSIIMKTTDRYMKKVSLAFVIGLVVMSLTYPFVVINEFDWVFTATLVLIIGFNSFCENYFGFASQILLQADQKEYIISISNIVTIILNTVFAYVLIKANASIHVVKIGSSMAFALKPIFLYLYAKYKYRLNRNVSCEMGLLKQTRDAFTHTIAEFIHMNTDVVILSFFTNSSVVSVYSIYCLIINGLRKLIRSITSNIEAVLGELKNRENIDRFEQVFHIFEFLVFFLSTIVFTCAALLSEPFVMVYTKNITDINYSCFIFAVLISIAELFYSLRLPYQYLIRIFGKFKETKLISVCESIINIVISLLLVSKYKLVGIAIGTLAAMVFRTVAYQHYSLHTLIRKNSISFYMNSLSLFISAIITTLLFYLIKQYVTVNSYLSWVAFSLITLIISVLASSVTFLIFQRKQLLEWLKIFRPKKQ